MVMSFLVSILLGDGDSSLSEFTLPRIQPKVNDVCPANLNIGSTVFASINIKIIH